MQTEKKTTNKHKNYFYTIFRICTQNFTYLLRSLTARKSKHGLCRLKKNPQKTTTKKKQTKKQNKTARQLRHGLCRLKKKKKKKKKNVFTQLLVFVQTEKKTIFTPILAALHKMSNTSGAD